MRDGTVEHLPVHELVPGAGSGVGEVVGGNVHGCEQVVGNGCDEG